MKILFVFGLSAGAFLSSARADVPAPKPTVITVTNLAAFPKYKFSYRTEDRPESKPIADARPFSVHRDVQLLVQRDTESAQPWETIPYDWRGAKVAIKIENVKQEGKVITVTHTTTGGGSAPGRKKASTEPQMLPLLTLTGIGACGLVLLARRRKAA